jgi:SAM-dependent methyltransferase
MIDTSLALYEDIALEYYDSVRHPTCANFREASAFLLKRWLKETPHERGWLCEVGAGNSLLAELTAAEGQSEAELIITDSSPSMLSYSSQWANAKTHLVLSDALMLPFTSERFDLLVSSLGDPYNVPVFWKELHRVLRSGAVAFFTTPAYDWAVAFRNGHQSDLPPAEFELLKGGTVYVPSWIYSLPDQIEMIENSGLSVREHLTVSLSAITATPLSPKLLIDRGTDADVVEGYLVRKPE